MTKLPQRLLDYCGGAATHIHSSFPLNPTCSGTQSIAEVAQMAYELGFAAVAFAEHTTDPAKPYLPGAALYTAIDLQVADVEAYEGPVRLFTGFEANIFPNGYLDVPSGDLNQWADIIIASQHGGLGAAEKDAQAILARLTTVCDNPFVTAIGHPSRYNDEVPGVDWPQIFKKASDTSTVIEFNLNLYYGKGPGRGLDEIKDERWFNTQLLFWETWTRQLVDSGAPVMFSLDAHNPGMWPNEVKLEKWTPTFDKLDDLIELFDRVGLKPAQVINSDFGLFEAWIYTDKAERSVLATW